LISLQISHQIIFENYHRLFDSIPHCQFIFLIRYSASSFQFNFHFAKNIMSDSDDFELGDSDDDKKEENKKSTKDKNASVSKIKRPADTSQVTANKNKKNSTFSSSDDDEDDNEDEVEDTLQSTKKKAIQKKTETAATKGHMSHTIAKPEGISSSSISSSSASSSSSSSSSLVTSTTSGMGGDDITRGPNVTTESAAKKLILQYLKQQNRPYSAIQVYDNLHKRIAKPTVERCLTTLSDNDGGLRVKEYGKAKIYFVDQKTMSSNFTQVLFSIKLLKIM
jgi:hypothetical protein